jgi:hypothetical protein
MQSPHRRKNCHQDIFQWTEEIAIAWAKLRAVRRVINKVPLKFQNSLLGFRGSMRSGIFYAVSNPLLSRPSRFLRTESASVCRTVQYGSLTTSTGFWKWTSSTSWKSQKVSITFPADNTNSDILVTSEPGCYHCMDACFDSVWKWRTHDSFVEYVFVLSLVTRKLFQFQSHSCNFVFVSDFYGKHLAQIFENADNLASCCRPPHPNTQ